MSSRKYIPSPGGVLPNGMVYEQIQSGAAVQYAVKTNKGVGVEPFLSGGEHIVYQPVAPSEWNAKAWVKYYLMQEPNQIV